jgi:hypothetical protein
MAHEHKHVDMKQAEEEERIAKEMFPFLFYAAIPILIIVFMALKWGPSY